MITVFAYYIMFVTFTR